MIATTWLFLAASLTTLGIGIGTPAMTVWGAILVTGLLVVLGLAVRIVETRRQVATYRMAFRHGFRVGTALNERGS